MSLAEQIRELEDEAADYRMQAEKYERSCNELKDENENLTGALEEATAFVDYIDETSPELRTAWAATKKLEGATT